MTIELITEAQHLWHLRRTGMLSADEHEVALFALEQRHGLDVTPCARCGIRHAWRSVEGASLCHHCRALGDEEDRGWESHKEATDAWP